ncbi:Holliday junction resolvase RecU [Enterococcus bulliens]
MVFRYPNGQPAYVPTSSIPSKKRKPNFANRGMVLEEAINTTNRYYAQRNLAVVHKKPTPIQIVAVDYPKRSAAVIKEAYFKEASTTDYNGVYRGYYLDFEAKETKNKTSFPLKNFHQHQIDHIRACLAQQGICFVLLWFSSLERCFFLDGETLLTQWTSTTRQSLPLALLEEKGIELQLGFAPQIPYLLGVDQYLQTKEQTTHGKRVTDVATTDN